MIFDIFVGLHNLLDFLVMRVYRNFFAETRTEFLQKKCTTGSKLKSAVTFLLFALRIIGCFITNYIEFQNVEYKI